MTSYLFESISSGNFYVTLLSLKSRLPIAVVYIFLVFL